MRPFTKSSRWPWRFRQRARGQRHHPGGGAGGVSVIPRARNGLSGGAIGDGLVVDFARYNRNIFDLNLERKTVRVGAGVVLDQLNDFLHPHKLCFARMWRPVRARRWAA